MPRQTGPVSCERLKARHDAGKPRALATAIRKGCDWTAGLAANRGCEAAPRAFVTTTDKERAFLASSGVCGPDQRAKASEAERQRLIDAALACVGVRPSKEFRGCVVDGYGRVRPVAPPVVLPPVPTEPFEPLEPEPPPPPPPKVMINPFVGASTATLERREDAFDAVNRLLKLRYPFSKQPEKNPVDELTRKALRDRITVIDPALLPYLEDRYRKLDRCERMLLPREIKGVEMDLLRSQASVGDPLKYLTGTLLDEYAREEA